MTSPSISIRVRGSTTNRAEERFSCLRTNLSLLDWERWCWLIPPPYTTLLTQEGVTGEPKILLLEEIFVAGGTCDVRTRGWRTRAFRSSSLFEIFRWLSSGFCYISAQVELCWARDIFSISSGSWGRLLELLRIQKSSTGASSPL